MKVYRLLIETMKIGVTEESPHLWPKRLPFYFFNIIPAFFYIYNMFR